MINFFLLSFPIFAVIGVGWAATRTRLVAQGALDALNAFSFRFALPALLLRLIAGQPLRQSFNASVLYRLPRIGRDHRRNGSAHFRRYFAMGKIRGTPRMRSHI